MARKPASLQQFHRDPRAHKAAPAAVDALQAFDARDKAHRNRPLFDRKLVFSKNRPLDR